MAAPELNGGSVRGSTLAGWLLPVALPLLGAGLVGAGGAALFRLGRVCGPAEGVVSYLELVDEVGMRSAAVREAADSRSGEPLDRELLLARGAPRLPAANPDGPDEASEPETGGRPRLRTNLDLQGIIRGADRNLAVVNGRVVGAGDRLGPLLVVEIRAAEVTFVDPAGRKIVLYRYRED